MRIVDLSVSPVFSLLMVGWLVGVFANNYYFKQHNKKHYIKNKLRVDVKINNNVNMLLFLDGTGR